MKTTSSIIAFALIAAGVAVAGEPKGVQRWEQAFTFSFSDGTAIPVPCLGTSLAGTEYATLWMHEFYSPVSGTYHIIFQNHSEVELSDQAGNTWLGKGEGSFEQNVSRGSTVQYVARYLFTPVGDNNGPMWKMENNQKVTVNAKGELVVERPGASGWEDVSSCLPATKK